MDKMSASQPLDPEFTRTGWFQEADLKVVIKISSSRYLWYIIINIYGKTEIYVIF